MAMMAIDTNASAAAGIGGNAAANITPERHAVLNSHRDGPRPRQNPVRGWPPIGSTRDGAAGAAPTGTVAGVTKIRSQLDLLPVLS